MPVSLYAYAVNAARGTAVAAMGLFAAERTERDTKKESRTCVWLSGAGKSFPRIDVCF